MADFTRDAIELATSVVEQFSLVDYDDINERYRIVFRFKHVRMFSKSVLIASKAMSFEQTDKVKHLYKACCEKYNQIAEYFDIDFDHDPVEFRPHLDDKTIDESYYRGCFRHCFEMLKDHHLDDCELTEIMGQLEIHQMRKDRVRQATIAKKQAEIARLQAEIDRL